MAAGGRVVMMAMPVPEPEPVAVPVAMPMAMSVPMVMTMVIRVMMMPAHAPSIAQRTRPAASVAQMPQCSKNRQARQSGQRAEFTVNFG